MMKRQEPLTEYQQNAWLSLQTKYYHQNKSQFLAIEADAIFLTLR